MSPRYSPTDYNPWDGECKNLNGKGAYVLQGFILAESPWDESRNLGIYNCRPPSVHGHERAGDTGFPVVNGKAHWQGFDLAYWLWNKRDYFGVQLVIWNRKIISRTKPWWREYNGPSPHIDHVHWELNWWGYYNLTRAIIEQHLPNDMPTIPPLPQPVPQPTYLEDDMVTAFKHGEFLDALSVDTNGDLVARYWPGESGWAKVVLASGCLPEAKVSVVQEYRGETNRLDLFVEAVDKVQMVHCWFTGGVWRNELLQ